MAGYQVAIVMFQSSPALSSGRYHGLDYAHAARSCFNPRPPFRAGATIKSLTRDDPKRVSILARPFERALQDGDRLSGAQLGVSILARPFERALPYHVSSIYKMYQFQSSPALSSGRYELGWNNVHVN